MKRRTAWKKIVAVGFAFSLLVSPVTGVEHAAKADTIIRAKQGQIVNPDLCFGNGTAQCNLYVKVEAGVSKIGGSLTLQRIEGNAAVTAAKWDVSANGRVLTVMKTAKVKKGKYKLVVCVKTHKGKQTETIIKSVIASYS